MLQTLTSMQLHCRRLAELEAAGTIRPEQASLAKVHNTRAAREIASNARDLLGGSGILLENRAVRHRRHIEAPHTDQGPDTTPTPRGAAPGSCSRSGWCAPAATSSRCTPTRAPTPCSRSSWAARSRG